MTPSESQRALQVRWLGTVPYAEALDLQRRLHVEAANDHLLLLEHPSTYTLGIRAKTDHVLAAPEALGAPLIETDRGGDVTFHGPGQLVGYPILTLADHARGRLADTVAYVRRVEQLIITALAELGLDDATTRRGHPGVWIDVDGDRPRKVCAIGVKLTRGRSMHGFALNVKPDLTMFDRIVPCGITDASVTSLAAEGIDMTMQQVVETITRLSPMLYGDAPQSATSYAGHAFRVTKTDLSAFTRGAGLGTPDQDVGALAMTKLDPEEARAKAEAARSSEQPVRLLGRLAEAGVQEGMQLRTAKPSWMRVKLDTGPEYMRLKNVMKTQSLTTVCEDAGCPNIFECWNDGTATFMINGERCTRACGFCLVDTSKPLPLDADEPRRVAEAVAEMRLKFAVITAVARDDLPDGGADAFAQTIRAIRARTPDTEVEVLISDCHGDAASQQLIFDARPDVLNHNVETVPRLQRAVRPSASYARSLTVLARAKAQGLITKSGLIVGMGETDDEVRQVLVDLRAIGIDIVTIGQYLRPTSHHLPIARWVAPATFDSWRLFGESIGIAHVESSPLTRSSHHARQASTSARTSNAEPARISS